MAIEMGAKAGLMEFDQSGKMVGRAGKPKTRACLADEDAKYFDVQEYDVSLLEPQIASPHTVDNVFPVAKRRLPIQQCYIGTCTNGRLDDLRVAASILAGKKIRKGCVLSLLHLQKTITGAMKEGLCRHW